MSTFGLSEHYCRNKLDGAKGWVMANWARENNNSIFGTNEERKTPGYIRQEFERIKSRRKK